MKVMLDISNNNGGPRDFTKLRSAWIDGVMNLGGQGDWFVSDVFGRDYWAENAAGLRTGCYWFVEWMQPWPAQLAKLKETYGRHGGDYPPALDFENYRGGGRWNAGGLSASWDALAGYIRQALADVAEIYGDAWCYLDRDWLTNLEPRGASWGHGVWLALGGLWVPSIAMQMGQITVPGIEGSVDYSLLYEGS